MRPGGDADNGGSGSPVGRGPVGATVLSPTCDFGSGGSAVPVAPLPAADVETTEKGAPLSIAIVGAPGTALPFMSRTPPTRTAATTATPPATIIHLLRMRVLLNGLS